jgi:hypothetical protein
MVPSEVVVILEEDGEGRDVGFILSLLDFVLDTVDEGISRGRNLLLETIFPCIIRQLFQGGREHDIERMYVRIVFASFDHLVLAAYQQYIEISILVLLQVLHRYEDDVIMNTLCGIGFTRFTKRGAEAFKAVLITLNEKDKLFLQTIMRNAVLTQSSSSNKLDHSSTSNKIDLKRYV